MLMLIQWNHSKADTIWTVQFVLYRAVSLTQGLLQKYKNNGWIYFWKVPIGERQMKVNKYNMICRRYLYAYEIVQHGHLDVKKSSSVL